MFNLNSLPSSTMTDSIIVNPAFSEPIISESEKSVNESKPS